MALTDATTRAGSVLERFAAANAGTEIWWDSSPLVIETWRAQMLEAAAPEDRDELEEDLLRLWDPENPEATLFRGVTTNPPLSLAAIQDDPARWAEWIRAFHAEHPDAGVEPTFWALYKEIVRLGAEALHPLHEASGYRFGHISAQVDPRSAFDTDAMLRQAYDLAAIAPNVMVKVPGSTEGMAVLRELTRHGISTNTTLAYTVPQFIETAQQVQAGLIEAREQGVDLTHWRSVITDMAARWEDSPAFVTQGVENGVELSPEDLRLAGVAVFQRAQRIFRQQAYPSKMLICSLRTGPVVDGVERCWHLEHTAGADAVFTLPPNFLTALIQRCSSLSFEPHIWDELPAELASKLRRVPYFNASIEPDGIPVEKFNEIEPLQRTAEEFRAATEKMVAFVREQLEAL